DFEKLNCDLIGLSIDQVFSHMKWTEWIRQNLGVEIKFPIIADDSGKIAAKMGMVHPGKGTNTVRAVFIIDPEGKVRLIIYYPQEIGRNMDEVLRALKALQTSDNFRISTPANWPNNELIGDEVLIPPLEMRKQLKRGNGWGNSL
ncbi:MAG: peroxiredoxin, partial [Methanotrichaceae archaeon]|nr:peroxiredoxin [Methanotrichaceae archaeon]